MITCGSVPLPVATRRHPHLPVALSPQDLLTRTRNLADDQVAEVLVGEAYQLLIVGSFALVGWVAALFIPRGGAREDPGRA